MKINRHRIKTRACDDWYEDEEPCYYTGTSYELSDGGSRFRSVSPAAHRAMHSGQSQSIGFHRPKA